MDSNKWGNDNTFKNEFGMIVFHILEYICSCVWNTVDFQPVDIE